MNLKELLEARAKLFGQIDELRKLVAKEGRAFTADEDEKWGKLNSDYDSLTKRIEVQQRGEAIELAEAEAAKISSFQTKPAGVERQEGQLNNQHYALAVQAWCRTGKRKEITTEQKEACQRLNFDPAIMEIDFPLMPSQQRAAYAAMFRSGGKSQLDEVNQRALSDFLPATGGYLRNPGTLVSSLEINMLAFGGMLQVADVINTANGDRMAWPTADDTSNTGYQIGENTAITTTAQPSFAQVFWDAYMFCSGGVLVPFALTQDSQFDVGSMLGGMLGERLGRITNTKCTTGTGAGTVKGITNCTSLGVTSATAAAITADELLGLVHSIDPAYRNGSRFMFHDSILLWLRKLKDGEGRYLWQQGIGTAPDTLWGYPYTINQDMTGTTSGLPVTAVKHVIFGQLSKYKIRQVGSVRFRQLNERYADSDQVGFMAFTRFDGNLLTAGTAPVKHLLQA